MSTQAQPRISALDGMRGIAILMVILDHMSSAWCQNAHLIQPEWMKQGSRGVSVFFFLSGYLITSRLKAEYDRTGHIDLKRFYLRRFFRLMPAAWTFLAVVWILSPQVTLGEIRAAVFFYRNYYAGSVLCGHFWSLSVEEQFYLVWPALVVLAGFRRVRAIAVYGALGIVCWRFAHAADYRTPQGFFRTEYRADMLLAGCWLGLRGMPSPGRFGLIASRMLSWRPLVRVGTLSYSLYLWQQPFTRLTSNAETAAAVISVTFLAAYLSYCLIEQPMIAFGKRMCSGERHRVVGEGPCTVSPAPARRAGQIEFRYRNQIPARLNG